MFQIILALSISMASGHRICTLHRGGRFFAVGSSDAKKQPTLVPIVEFSSTEELFLFINLLSTGLNERD